MKKIEWEKFKAGLMSSENYVLQGKEFYISYNKNVRSSRLGGLLDDILHSAVGEDKNYTGEETALVKKGEDNKFYILNGDFRKEYEKVFTKGFKACYKFYLKNKKEKGSILSEKFNK